MYVFIGNSVAIHIIIRVSIVFFNVLAGVDWSVMRYPNIHTMRFVDHFLVLFSVAREKVKSKGEVR